MKLLIHGGFFSESSQSAETKIAKQQAMERIISLAHDYLHTHSANETVVYAVKLLEDDALFNAGIGSQIQRDGVIRMS
ncbi:MAG: isoaspartyl peptidase/L-asparaginase, partial [Crocinitomicaceae bacterium]